jgi:hypothetical protein
MIPGFKSVFIDIPLSPNRSKGVRERWKYSIFSIANYVIKSDKRKNYEKRCSVLFTTTVNRDEFKTGFAEMK